MTTAHHFSLATALATLALTLSACTTTDPDPFVAANHTMRLSLISVEEAEGDTGEIDYVVDANQELVTLDDSFFEEEFDDDVALVEISDPIEPFNRAMFAFNDWTYRRILRPVSRGYAQIMPNPMEEGIDNFFSNLLFPSRLVNHTLQADFVRAGRETQRFIYDSTAGLLGFMKPSADFPELQGTGTDTGVTLAVWGLDHGFYVVWPILGPSSLRDSVGRVGDGFLNPTFYMQSNEAKIGLNLVSFLNSSDELLEGYFVLKDASLDPYIGMRDAYAQRREQGEVSKRDQTLFRVFF